MSIQQRSNSPIDILVGHFVFICYLFLCVFFYAERSLYTDSSNYLFNILNDGLPFTPHGRWPAAIPQIPLVVISWFDFNPRIEFVIHSLSYPLFYYLIFILILHHFKNKTVAFSLLLLLLLGVFQSFYIIVFEAQLAIIYASLFYASYEAYYNKREIKNLIIGLGTAYLSIITHIQIIPLILIFCALHFMKFQRKKTALLTLSYVVVVSCYKYFLVQEAAYVSQQISTPGVVLSRLYSLAFIPALKEALTNSTFIPMHLLYLLTTLTLIIQQKQKYAISLIFFYSFYLLSISLFAPHSSNLALEKNLMILPVILGSFLFDKETLKQPEWLASVIFGLAMVSFLCFLNISRRSQSERISYQKQLIKHLPKSGKYFLKESDLPKHLFRSHWAFGIESLLIGYWNEEDEQSIIYVIQEHEKPLSIDKNHVALTKSRSHIPIKNFKQNKFKIDSTKSQSLLPEDVIQEFSRAN